MPLHSLIPNEDGLRPDYKMLGDFQAIMYFCPDIRKDYKDKSFGNACVEKTEQELISELDNCISRLSTLSYTWLNNNKIIDYWLVITPLLCDRIQEFDKNIVLPRRRNNYIVTPFYLHEIDFIKALYKAIPNAYGTVDEHPDIRRRRGTEAEIGFYVACQVNPESHIDFSEIEFLERDSDEFRKKLDIIILKIELELGTEATYSLNDQIRTFMQYGNDRFGLRFVEQYFNLKASKKVNGYPLGEGYIRNRMAKVNLSKNEKYAVFHDLFASRGYQFADYALSKEDLKSELASFERQPWVITDIVLSSVNQKTSVDIKDEGAINEGGSPIPSKISEHEKNGIIFEVEYVIEIFKAPLTNIKSNQESPQTALELFGTSVHSGFDRLYLCKSEIVQGVSSQNNYTFTREDFLQWQLERVSSVTLFHIAEKTDARVAASCNTNFEPAEKLINFFDEIVKDPDFSPDEWLNENIQDDDNRNKGINLISRLRREKPDEFYKLMIEGILDKNTGLLQWLESEVKDNLASISDLYAHWPVPLIVVSEGRFSPCIDPNSLDKLKLSNFQLHRMYIRNYDEDERT